MEPTEYSVLEILKEYKWGPFFICRSCGHEEYKKGKKPFSRRCKACDRDESVLVYTALEGVRIPIEKTYLILDYIWKHCSVNHDEKTIPWEKRAKRVDDFGFDLTDNYNKGDSISVIELLDRWKKGKISDEAVNNLLVKNLEEHKLNIAETAMTFGIEENSLSNLLKKINTRITHVRDNWDDPVESIFDFIANDNYDFDEFLGLLMYPMDEKWVKGKRTLSDGRVYELMRPSRVRDSPRWRLVETV